MGIRSLKKFVEERPNLLEKIRLRNCDVILDGNSIYHQMYSQTELICLFGGEYDRFYHYCVGLFESFQKCNINSLVVFDGAQVDNRKWSTSLDRAQQRIEKSSSTDPKVELSPLLLRETFINVLDAMKIPYVSALRENDDECVSLANHLRCYLMAEDSDYYCYNLRHGYIPFDYIDVNPMKEGSTFYLQARLYNIDSLLNQFNGLQPETLALACCLSRNDYIRREDTTRLLQHIDIILNRSQRSRRDANNQTSYIHTVLRWTSGFSNIDAAFNELFPANDDESEQIQAKLREAITCYLTPSDTLIYRFISSENHSLRNNDHFVNETRTCLTTLGMNDDQIRDRINDDSQRIRREGGRPLPLFLTDAVSDCRLWPSFIEILVHRRLICKAHIELRNKPSIYSDAISIIEPCFKILLKWDQALGDSSVTTYRRVGNRLEAVATDFNDLDNNLPALDQIWTMAIEERQNFIQKCLKVSNELLQLWNNIPADYHFWLMILRYWYFKRQPPEVYLYAVLICLVKFVFLREDKEFSLMQPQLDSLVSVFANGQRRQNVNPTRNRAIRKKLNQMYKNMMEKRSFDNTITHELNCLQTIYLYSMRVNEFFNLPFMSPIHPHYFISGSLFHALVSHYRTKVDLNAAMDALLQNETILLDFIHNLYKYIAFT